jgi:hypothetical protein
MRFMIIRKADANTEGEDKLTEGLLDALSPPLPNERLTRSRGQARRLASGALRLEKR